MNRNIIITAMAALIVGFLPSQAIVAHAEETQPNMRSTGYLSAGMAEREAAWRQRPNRQVMGV
jgi:hypothetical protein